MIQRGSNDVNMKISARGLYYSKNLQQKVMNHLVNLKKVHIFGIKAARMVGTFNSLEYYLQNEACNIFHNTDSFFCSFSKR